MVRFKNRYFVLEINPNDINRKDLSQTAVTFNTTSYSISRTLLQLVEKIHGEFGCAAMTSGFTVKYCNEHTRVALVRVRCGPHRLLASAIPFLNSLEGKSISINTLYIGATIKHCVKFIKQYQQHKIETELCKFKDKPEYENLCKLYMNIQPAFNLR